MSKPKPADDPRYKISDIADMLADALSKSKPDCVLEVRQLIGSYARLVVYTQTPGGQVQCWSINADAIKEVCP